MLPEHTDSAHGRQWSAQPRAGLNILVGNEKTLRIRTESGAEPCSVDF